MSITEIRFMEHLAVKCQLSLRAFCEQMQRRFELPDFQFDFENETEWGFAIREGIEYNVSRPYEPGTLELWDDSVPTGCNFGETLIVSNHCPAGYDIEWSLAKLVPPVAQALADLVDRDVYHHRTWVEAGNNLIRNQVYKPGASGKSVQKGRPLA